MKKGSHMTDQAIQDIRDTKWVNDRMNPDHVISGYRGNRERNAITENPHNKSTMAVIFREVKYKKPQKYPDNIKPPVYTTLIKRAKVPKKALQGNGTLYSQSSLHIEDQDDILA